MQLPVPELLPLAQLYSGTSKGSMQGNDRGRRVCRRGEALVWLSMAVFVPVTDYKAFVAQLHAHDANAKIAEVTVIGSQFLVDAKGRVRRVGARPTTRRFWNRSWPRPPGRHVEPIEPWLANQQIARDRDARGQEVAGRSSAASSTTP